MKKSLLTLTTAVLLSGQVQAEQTLDKDHRASVGFATGLATGAVVGGPLGGLIGGVMGLLIGDEITDEQRITSANQQLVMMEKEYQQALLLARQKEQRMEQLRLVSLQNALQDAVTPVETKVQFKTGSYLLEPHYRRQLDLIAAGLEKQPKAMVNLQGHADPRGDKTYNQALSQQRVLSVKNYLVKQGLSPRRIKTEALGESAPVAGEPGLERFFFDRRVDIKVEKHGQVLTASTQATP